MDQNTLLLVVAAGMFAMMFFSSRKRKRQAAELADKVQAGARVMLSSGIFGTIVSVDGERVVVESTPGIKLEVSRSAIVRFVAESVETPAVAEVAEVTPVAKTSAAKPAATKVAATKTPAAKAPAKKPAAKTTK